MPTRSAGDLGFLPEMDLDGVAARTIAARQDEGELTWIFPAWNGTAPASPNPTAASLALPGMALQAMDAVVLATVLFFAGVIIAFAPRIHDPWPLLLRLGFWGLFYVASLALQRRISAPAWRALLRMGSVQVMFAQIYLIVHPLQLIFVRNWQDPAILRLEDHAVRRPADPVAAALRQPRADRMDDVLLRDLPGHLPGTGRTDLPALGREAPRGLPASSSPWPM